MKCPYCAEDIKNEAIACRYCQRDFFVIQPLMAKLKAANKRIKFLEAKLSNVGVDPDSHEAIVTTGPKTVTQTAVVVAATVDDRIPTLPAWATVMLTFFILVLAHYFIVIVFDASLIYLRIVSIVAPLMLGFVYRKSLDRWLFWDLCTALLIAAAAILTMSAVVAHKDEVPILPQDAHGWIEYAQYAASIGFGFFTGCVLRHGLMVTREPSPKVSFLVELISRFIARKMKSKDDEDDDDEPKDAIDAQVKKIESMVSGLIAAGSVAVSLYTGLSGLIH